MSGTLARHSGHEVTVKFHSRRDTTTLRRLDCACGWAMTWLPELKGGDPDQPVLDGYAPTSQAGGRRGAPSDRLRTQRLGLRAGDSGDLREVPTEGTGGVNLIDPTVLVHGVTPPNPDRTWCDLVRPVLRTDGALWCNLGDTYAASGKGGGGSRGDRKNWRSIAGRSGWRTPPAGYKPKDITLAPFLVADALRRDGWYLRQVVVWSKPQSPEPERLDRPSSSHEYVFLLTPSEHYSTRNPGGAPWWFRSVWEIRTDADSSHQAMMPTELAARCIRASTKTGDVVLDPFAGSGTVGRAAASLSRKAVLIDLNPDYLRQCLARNAQTPLGLPA